MRISVCFPCVNEQQQAEETAKSIRETAGDAVEIVCCDDCSATPIVFPRELGVVVHRNRFRIGSGASRHVLALVATGDYMLMLDCHCRLEPNWVTAVEAAVEKYPNSAFCGVCHGFTPSVPPFGRPSGIYYGADLQFVGHDPNKPSRMQVLEPVWANKREDGIELSCLLGANYVVSRGTFLRLGGMQHFRVWGCEEQMLSLKYWLSGGEVRLLHGLKTWHLFRDGEKLPFRLELWNFVQNKLFTIHTIFPDDMAERMISRFPKGFDLNKATETIHRDWGLVEAERERNKSLFVHDCNWLLNKFQIPLL